MLQGFVVVLKWVAIVIGVLLAVLVVVLAVLPPLTRAGTDRWGATDAETITTFPGDELVPVPQQASTRAVSIDAPPALVFALLKQMGYARGGWYGWDWFYRSTGSADFVDGHHSRRVDPALQGIGKGATMELFPGAALEIVVFDPPRSMVLYKVTDEKNALVPADAPKPETYSDMLWGWHVVPTQDGGSRLVLRTKASSAGMPGFVDWINDGPLEMGGAVFGRKTLVGIKRLAERLDAAGVQVDAEGRQVAGPTGDDGQGGAQ